MSRSSVPPKTASASPVTSPPARAKSHPVSYVTVGRAQAHEALVLRVTRLLRQVEAVAGRRPGEGVAGMVAALAGDLLFEARTFGSRPAGSLPAVAPDYAGLAAQLGQALAGLDAFEARHSRWDAAQRAFVWRLGSGSSALVARLRPQSPTLAPADARQPGPNAAELWRRMQQRERGSFIEGFKAGRRGDVETPEQAKGYPEVKW